METSARSTEQDHYRVSWAPHGAVKRVEITRIETGTTFVGTDWASWDTAYQQALQQALTRRVS